MKEFDVRGSTFDGKKEGSTFDVQRSTVGGSTFDGRRKAFGICWMPKA
ncbi:MAG TPA: hypothetical protein VHO43_05110 [Ignavibacteriales bacterium]|nr:hypothetical protein [Ignavibacteriales bacterium]